MVDISPFDGSDPVDNAIKIIRELEKYNSDMLEEPRWLVLNKTDLMDREQTEIACRNIVERMDWKGPVYEISALSKLGTKELVFDIMNYLEKAHENATTTG